MDDSPITSPEDVPDGMTSKQCVWDNYGRLMKGKVAESPESYVLKGSPFKNEPWGEYFIGLLGSLEGKTVLDAGCGRGGVIELSHIGGRPAGEAPA